MMTTFLMIILFYLFLYLFIRTMDIPISFASWTSMSRKGPLLLKSGVLNIHYVIIKGVTWATTKID
jgi:hypothetical protein